MNYFALTSFTSSFSIVDFVWTVNKTYKDLSDFSDENELLEMLEFLPPFIGRIMHLLKAHSVEQLIDNLNTSEQSDVHRVDFDFSSSLEPMGGGIKRKKHRSFGVTERE